MEGRRWMWAGVDEDEYDEEDEEGYLPPPSHDEAGLHVMREQCSTCIFRAGDLMNLREGRLRNLTRATDRGDTNVVCHKTLDRPVAALCFGSVERNPGQMVRIAERMGVLRYDGEE